MLGSPYYHHQQQQAFASARPPMNAFQYPTTCNQFAHFPQYNHLPSHSNYSQHEYCDPTFRRLQPLEVIKLEEVPAPVPGPSNPRRCQTASQSYASLPESSYDSDDSEEESESGESFCSSDDELAPVVNIRRASSAEDDEPELLPIGSDTFSSRMRRIEAWRDAYAKAVGAELAPSPSRITSKRKGSSDEDNDDAVSRSSKRSRRSATDADAPSVASSVRSVHSCSACDTSFSSRQSLRLHGRSPRTNEACRAAVEYGFE